MDWTHQQIRTFPLEWCNHPGSFGLFSLKSYLNSFFNSLQLERLWICQDGFGAIFSMFVLYNLYVSTERLLPQKIDSYFRFREIFFIKWLDWRGSFWVCFLSNGFTRFLVDAFYQLRHFLVDVEGFPAISYGRNTHILAHPQRNSLSAMNLATYRSWTSSLIGRMAWPRASTTRRRFWDLTIWWVVSSNSARNVNKYIYMNIDKYIDIQRWYKQPIYSVRTPYICIYFWTQGSLPKFWPNKRYFVRWKWGVCLEWLLKIFKEKIKIPQQFLHMIHPFWIPVLSFGMNIAPSTVIF